MDWTPEQIKALRERFGFSQSAMAEAMGLSRTASVNDLEKGRTAATGATARLLDAMDAHGPRVGLETPKDPAARLDSLAEELRTVAASLRKDAAATGSAADAAAPDGEAGEGAEGNAPGGA